MKSSPSHSSQLPEGQPSGNGSKPNVSVPLVPFGSSAQPPTHQPDGEARHVEAQLRDSEERFRTLFDLGPVAVYYCAASGIIENFNRRAVELWGRAPVRGDTFERFCGSYKMYRLDGSFLPHERCPMAEVLQNEIPEALDQEVLIERPDGSRITVVVNIRQLKDEKGQVTGALNCFYDVTERKLAEHATARLAAIVECSDDAIIAKDLDGVIKSWNLGAERLFGYTAEQAIGKPSTMLLPPDRADDEALILESIRRGQHVNPFEAVRRHKDGRLLDVSLTISPIINAHGEIVGASKIARDITGRKLAEAALLRSEKLAAAGRLAAILAHEINNPLQAVANLIALLASSPRLEPEERALTKAAEEELGRIAHLTRQSLSFYRESASLSSVNLAETVEGVLSIFTNRIKAKELTLKKRYPSDAPVINSFAGEVRQVVSTLLVNAIDAVPKEGTISIHVHQSSRWGKSSTAGVRISIADNGIGISPSNIGLIFEPFFTTKGEQGTGLGLWVADGIVSRLGGSIRMRSSTVPGRSGSCFSIFLPIQMPAQSAHSEIAIIHSQEHP
jgi:two-component system, chemotaxis family, CheB/CheR fusion protein